MNVFLTGATGFLGGELLVSLSKREEINKIYCFLRASSQEEACLKIANIFALHEDYYDQDKIIAITGNLQDEGLTISLKQNTQLADVNVIIHSAANTSFSRIYDKLVEEVNIKGLEKILLWAKDLQQLQTFLYIGTATICGKDITNRVIYEDESPDTTANHLVRYTYTKMQGELLLAKHLSQQKILVARPSIIMGDSRPVLPRSPIILWAVATINQLRFIPVDEYAMLDMVPVNFAATAIVSLLFAKRNHQVYHISSGKNSATNAYKLAISLSAYFAQLPPFVFVDKKQLSQLKNWARGRLDATSDLNNYPVYIDYWHNIFPDTGALRILLAGLEPYLQFMDLGQVFDNSRLFADVPDLQAPVPAHVYINECMPFIAGINTLAGAFDS